MGLDEVNAKGMKKPAAAKALPKGKAKTAAKKAGAKSQAVKGDGGVKPEVRKRATGQKDRHYVSPAGTTYRTLGAAKANGFVE